MSKQLDSGWQERSLASLGHYINGFAFNDEHWSELGLPIVRIAQITGSQGIVDRFPGRLPDTYRLEDGDLIFSWSGTLAVVRWLGGSAWLNQHLFKVLNRRDIDKSFLFHLLQQSVAEMSKRTHGSTMKHIKRGELEEFLVKLPTELAEQAQIAAVLDALDTAIRQTEAIVEKLEHLKQGLLHDLMTRGIDANGELRPGYEDAPHLYQDSKLGWIPLGWTVGSLSTNCSEVVDCPHSTPVFTDVGVLVARTMHIKDGEFLEGQASRVSEKQYRERIARLPPQPGDVIFTREAPVGEAFVIPAGMKICLGQRVMLLRPKLDVLSANFLLAQIYSGAVHERIGTLTSGTTNPHLNVAEVRDFMIPLPPYDEQIRIGERISAASDRLSKEVRELSKLNLQKTGLMDDLLSGRVRVTPLLAQ